MKTKAKIVERLLEEKTITAEEAVVLLTEISPIRVEPFIGRPFEPILIEREDDMVPYGEICSCNPKNGGSGICGCVMGNTMVPRKTDIYKSNWSTTISIGDAKCKNGTCFCDGSCKKD